MQAWLYQMSTATDWYPKDYCLEVWEGDIVPWPVGQIKSREKNKKLPEAGDLIVFFFAKTRNDDPGIYGWGVITDFNSRTNKIKFGVTPPSDYLKMDPIWDKEIEKLIDKVRGGMNQRTMWSLTRDELDEVRRKIRTRFQLQS